MTVTTNFSPVKVHYFDFGDFAKSLPKDVGRGENIRLFLEDAGIPHEYILYPWSEWPVVRDEWIQNGYLTGTLPALQTNDGKKYFHTVPILCFLSKQLGKYYGKNVDEEYLVDVVADTANDFYDSFVHNYWLRRVSDNRENHHKNEAPIHIDRLERFYKINEGPYLLGSEISFADFQVYHVIRDEQLTELPPRLATLIKTFEERPNIKKYLEAKKNN
ncbi:glutathione S-transferase [Phascolomyces articulosus]|uniref:Glutathione S-transferase n=1 Tax=Phascolomyces articulosus TaxID=60185 RepID=A0AAD5K262_9FUNG|nr:glutathione S-transferase [Phascolomyces articulosus]